MINSLIKEYSVQIEDNLLLFSKINLLYDLHIIDEDSKNNFHNIRKLGNATVMKEHCELREQTSSDEVDFQEKNRAEELFDCLCTECYKFSSEYVPNAKSIRKRLFVRIKKDFYEVVLWII